MRSLSNEQLIHLDRTAVWHAFSQMAHYDGLIIESGRGCWLTDIHGKRYLDGASSLWCNVFGHAVPEIDQAIRDQLERVAHVTNLGMSHPTTIELAAKLIELAPPGMHHAFFSGDGASAVEVAMKLAFQYWRQCDRPEPNRTKFLALGDAYHGDTLGTMAVGGVSRFQAVFQPLLFDVVRGPCPDAYRRPEGMDLHQACQHYLACYRAMLERHAHETVAVIAEPRIQGAAGFVCHPPGFFRGLHGLCKEFGVLLIADEIAVGMGRTGKMFAMEHEAAPEAFQPDSDSDSVSPDLLCIGKGLTGGYLAMSATLATDRIWDAFLGTHEQSRTFFHGHTYGGNPLASAAALAVLHLFETSYSMPWVQARGERLGDRLASLRDLPMVGDVRRLGMMAAIDFVSDPSTKQPPPWTDRITARVCEAAIRRGVWLRPLGHVIPVLPPLTIDDNEIAFLCDVLREAILETVS
ncbi:MAG: adenosylmethionine--8-amino-7-oxononanoate transaminase [Pirellula sp.]